MKAITHRRLRSKDGKCGVEVPLWGEEHGWSSLGEGVEAWAGSGAAGEVVDPGGPGGVAGSQVEDAIPVSGGLA
jgi:hypothetical protein